MTTDEYFERMKALGYPAPSLRLWIDDDDGRKRASASFRGTCGHGGRAGDDPKSWDEMISLVFNHVTDGGKTFRAMYP